MALQLERFGALSRMARCMAHDINNSLTPIIGYSDFILETQPGLPEELKHYLNCIRAAAEEIAQRVEQVRKFYRRRDEHEVLQSIDLNAVVSGCVDRVRGRCQPHAGRVEIQLRTHFATALPKIQENAQEVQDAIQHMIINAIEAMPQGGAMTVSTRAMKNRAIVEVQDTGIGMDSTTRQHCFDPFFSTKLTRGSGLGLAMVYGLMRRHGGEIELESQSGLGTTVRLLFHAGAHTVGKGEVNPIVPPSRSRARRLQST